MRIPTLKLQYIIPLLVLGHGSALCQVNADTLSYSPIATDSFSMSDGEIGLLAYQMPGDARITGFNIRVAE